MLRQHKEELMASRRPYAANAMTQTPVGRSRPKLSSGDTDMLEVPKNGQRCRRFIKRTPLEIVIRFLDRTFPDVGVNCPNFPVMVVLFSAARLRTANIGALCEFTRYAREYVEAIAENMANNRLWQGDEYIASGWLRDGCLDEDEFGRQIDAALGTLFYSDEAVASGRRRDVLEFNSAYDETVPLMSDTAALLS
jgi:hypothetical protein